MIDRRGLIAGAAALGLITPVRAAAGEVIELWPDGTPGGEAPRTPERTVPRSEIPGDVAYLHVARPRLFHHPATAPANGATLLLIPGGGYQRVALSHDRNAVADAFCAMGYTCFSLLYRLPGDGWSAGPEAPLQDAQRALRLIRARVGADGAERVGVIGFSAGGHLAARLTARQSLATYEAVDAADALPLSPRVAGLLYPVVLMEGEHVHRGSRTQLLGGTSAPDRLRALAADGAIEAGTPPTFIAHAFDDRTVPVENGLAMLAALRQAGVAVEAHLLERGGHGFGATVDGRPATWPMLFHGWAAAHGLT